MRGLQAQLVRWLSWGGGQGQKHFLCIKKEKQPRAQGKDKTIRKNNTNSPRLGKDVRRCKGKAHYIEDEPLEILHLNCSPLQKTKFTVNLKFSATKISP